MKLTSPALTCLLAVGFAAAVHAQDIKLNIPGQSSTTPPATAPAASAATPAAPMEKFTETQMLEEYGWAIGKRIGLSDLDFTSAQVDTVLKGITSASQGKASPSELEKIGPQMDAFIKAKQAEYLAKLKVKGMAQSAAFLAKIKQQKGVVVLPDGLVYQVFEPGTGPAPKTTDTVTAHYIGALVDGTVFDSSVARGEPVTFPLTQMIPGWVEGLQHSAKGGKIRLYIPPDLAFGDDPRPGIPPASTLVFDVEIIDIKPTPPAPMPAAGEGTGAAPVPTTPPAGSGK